MLYNYSVRTILDFPIIQLLENMFKCKLKSKALVSCDLWHTIECVHVGSPSGGPENKRKLRAEQHVLTSC